MLGLGVAIPCQKPSGALVASIQITNLAFPENVAVGTVVAVLSTINTTGTPTFSEVADPDSKFEIDGANVKTTAGFNFEAAASHSFTIGVSGTTPDPADKQVSFEVQDVDETGGGASQTWRHSFF